MKKVLGNSYIAKGMFALAIVAIAGASGLVYAAQDTTPETGSVMASSYGSEEEATEAINELNDAYAEASFDFRAEVQGHIMDLRNALDDDESADEFAAAFTEANETYDEHISNASSEFLAAIQAAASTAESKDEFIDAYNRAKATYFGHVETAKNALAAALSPWGNDSNVAKDQFMNHFNAAKDSYGNVLEQIKNDFAATVSNLK